MFHSPRLVRAQVFPVFGLPRTLIKNGTRMLKIWVCLLQSCRVAGTTIAKSSIDVVTRLGMAIDTAVRRGGDMKVQFGRRSRPETEVQPIVTPRISKTPKQEEIEFQSLKQELHQSLVESLDLMAARDLNDDDMREQLAPFIDELIDQSRHSESGIDLTAKLRERMRAELPDEIFGVGPLEPLLRSPDIADILVNHPHEVFIERGGQLEPSTVVFADQAHLIRIIQRIASQVGRRIDEVSPMVDARLPDGSRVNAVICLLYTSDAADE